jgi:flagellar biosynthesis chaperone FliJ
MKRFNSRYERIRHLRAQEEDTCRAAAAARNTERAAAESHQNAMRLWLDTMQRTAARDLANGMSGGVLLSMTSMMDHGEMQLQAAAESLRKAEDNLKLALNQHSHARTELKIIEEVIHREHTEHRREQLRHEDIQMQEQASQAYHRMQEMRSEQ